MTNRKTYTGQQSEGQAKFECSWLLVKTLQLHLPETLITHELVFLKWKVWVIILVIL